ncbi:hypothetical protein LVJ94_33410 [Pendulispora rubella]|uniref:Uncharacterized protein n=1 Tax=Pendulispora rubella TaxID=2741070 RepID=A0ABZ2KT25_9BACT
MALLDEAGFSLYEKRALVSLGVLGVADAASTLWQKALRDLREIRFYPRRSRSSV